MAKNTEVAEKKPMGLMAMVAAQESDANLPAHAQRKSDRGNEDVSTEDLQVPRLKLIQAISDELKKNNPLYNPKAEAGDLLNSVTKQLFKMEEGLYVINLRSFGWTLELHWDVWTFVQALAVSVTAAMLAAVEPMRRLLRQPIAAALRQE